MGKIRRTFACVQLEERQPVFSVNLCPPDDAEMWQLVKTLNEAHQPFISRAELYDEFHPDKIDSALAHTVAIEIFGTITSIKAAAARIDRDVSTYAEVDAVVQWMYGQGASAFWPDHLPAHAVQTAIAQGHIVHINGPLFSRDYLRRIVKAMGYQPVGRLGVDELRTIGLGAGTQITLTQGKPTTISLPNGKVFNVGDVAIDDLVGQVRVVAKMMKPLKMNFGPKFKSLGNGVFEAEDDFES